MDYPGHVQNGVVVFDEKVSLPEGAAVIVTPRTGPVFRVSAARKRVQLPLVKTGRPGSVYLTNGQIAEILDAEDDEALKKQWNAPS